MNASLKKYGTWAIVYVFGVVMGRASLFNAPSQYPPEYGNGTGLPVNCSAYVEASIAGYRAKVYTADDAMNGLQRNCGARGKLWQN